MQQQILRDLLLRAGSVDVPPCLYSLPNNTVEMTYLMSTLKSVETGLFISLAESLPTTDAPAGIVLSNMAAVAARQKVILEAHINPNTSAGPFETPVSTAWAYNLAAAHARAGSCAVELPVPTLPALHASYGTAVFGRQGTSVTLTWDAAGRAAAARSGKPLFVGWVNQIGSPVYTPLVVLGDGVGTTSVPARLLGTSFAVLTAQPGLDTVSDLTQATIAGPLVVSVLP